MVEVKLPIGISGKRRAYLIEKAMRKTLVPRGYEVETDLSHESYYPKGSTKLTTVETGRSIIAKKRMTDSTKTQWGYVQIYASDTSDISTASLDWGAKDPELGMRGKYDSFHLHIVEEHITPQTVHHWVIEPQSNDYRHYRKDVQALMEELYRQLKVTK